ncbi:hypothetical protein CEXT_454581 [Caerostris extrusa]|uniref:Uncharacterized protein n=1 Tax=Caerostris extrusa TaxID=172846 RepID=A0AAV4N724_CAEEX|nr:hypothetical protein CEXT_454581 [Caerostris extrusa]
MNIRFALIALDDYDITMTSQLIWKNLSTVSQAALSTGKALKDELKKALLPRPHPFLHCLSHQKTLPPVDCRYCNPRALGGVPKEAHKDFIDSVS